jgi:hypothetical protein
MAITHFYHKSAPRNNSESPDPNLSMASNVETDTALKQQSSANLKIAAGVIGVQTIRVANTVIDATGNSQLKRNVQAGAAATGLILLAAKGGLLGVGLGAIAGVGNLAIQQIQEFERQEDDRYNQKLVGERVNKYNKGGVYND